MVSSKILVICGPTATGKTVLGVKLTRQLAGEIISADSRQVYRGMDIGTGKDLRELKGTPVWLLDVVWPDQKFSVADYLKLAWEVIEDIWARGKLPVIVGGTGFYIKAISDGIGTLGIPPDWELRRRLGDEDIRILGERLKKIDPQRWGRMNESDRKNPRRLIRAIEVAGKKLNTEDRKLDALFIGLTAPYETLYQRIDRRVEKRIKEGIEEEIKSLREKGYNFENSVLGKTIGYQEWQAYFEGKSGKDNVIQRWKFDEHNLARRQMTWFRKNRRICWFDISQPGWKDKVEKVVERWYIKTDAEEN